MRTSSFTILVLALLVAAVSLASEDRAQFRPSLERVLVDPALADVGDGDTVTIHWSDGCAN